MAHTTTSIELAHFDSETKAASREKRPSLLKRMANALAQSRRRKAEAAIGRFIQANGGTLTDNLEREIGRRFIDDKLY